jgi:hypothetical protein
MFTTLGFCEDLTISAEFEKPVIAAPPGDFFHNTRAQKA